MWIYTFPSTTPSCQIGTSYLVRLYDFMVTLQINSKSVSFNMGTLKRRKILDIIVEFSKDIVKSKM